MFGLVLLVLAELADAATSAYDMATGRGVEGNPWLPHTLGEFLLAKLLVVVGAWAAYQLVRIYPDGREDINVVFAFLAGMICLVAIHNLGVAQIA